MKENKKLLFSKNYTIRWQDMDAFNHVNHTVYLIYLQECRIDWLLHYGIVMDGATRGPVIGEVTCKYLRSITHPAEICVELYFSHKTGRRVYFEHIIRDKNNHELIYTTAHVVVVWVDFTTGKSIIPPPEYDYILDETIIINN